MYHTCLWLFIKKSLTGLKQVSNDFNCPTFVEQFADKSMKLSIQTISKRFMKGLIKPQ